MSDYSTVRAEKALDVTDYLHKEDDDRFGKNVTNLFMPGFSIFALYLLIGSAALYSIFASPIRDMLEKNLLVKHFLGYLTLLFFIVLTGAVEVNYIQAVFFTVFVYIWFVMTTKLSINYWLLTILILGGLYAIQMYKQTEEDLTHKEKKLLSELEYIGTAAGFLVTLVGFVTYYLTKKGEAGSSFRLYHFFNGKYD